MSKTQTETATIVIACSGADGRSSELACSALERALKDRGVLRVEQGTIDQAARNKAVHISIAVSNARVAQLDGLLSWQDCRSGTCLPVQNDPKLTTDVSDANVSDQTYVGLASALLKRSDVPINWPE